MDEPKIIPVSQEERIEGQKKALETLTGTRQTTLTGTGNEVDIAQYVPMLIAAFHRDYNVSEACSYAGLPRRTYYNHLKSNPTFAEEMRVAQEMPFRTSKNRMLQIIDKGEDRDAGPMVRWFLERRQKEIYGPTIAGNNDNRQQHNYFISVADLRELFRTTELGSVDGKKLSEVLEAQARRTLGGEKDSATSIPASELRDNSTTPVNLSQPPSTV